MSFDALIIDLNMDAVNALIWASAVLAKMGIFAAVVGGFLWMIVILLAMVAD